MAQPTPWCFILAVLCGQCKYARCYFQKTSFRYQFSQTDLSLFFPYLFSIFLSFCFTFLEISLSLSYNPLTKFFICVIMFVISKSFFLISEVIFSPVASFLFHDRLVFCYLPKDIPDSFSIFSFCLNYFCFHK